MDYSLQRELTRTLDEEVSLYKVLLAVVHKERECIISAAHQQLLDTVGLIEKNVRAIDEVKTRRREIMDQIAAEAGSGGENWDLEAVISVLPADVASAVRGFKAELESVIRHLGRLNEENVTFVSDALDLYRGFTDCLVQASTPPAPGYPEAPASTQRRQVSWLVNREV
jgi:predicted transcriptional regulator